LGVAHRTLGRTRDQRQRFVINRDARRQCGSNRP
jgi:hypothetical protein